MDSVELWFSDSEEEGDAPSSLLLLSRERRKVRDSSNPLELEEQIFLKNFRLPKAAFTNLLTLLDSKLQPGVRKTSIPTILKLAATLRLCAQGSYQLGVGNEICIGFGQSTVSLVLTEVFQTFFIIFAFFTMPKLLHEEIDEYQEPIDETQDATVGSSTIVSEEARTIRNNILQHMQFQL